MEYDLNGEFCDLGSVIELCVQCLTMCKLSDALDSPCDLFPCSYDNVLIDCSLPLTENEFIATLWNCLVCCIIW